MRTTFLALLAVSAAWTVNASAFQFPSEPADHDARGAQAGPRLVPPDVGANARATVDCTSIPPTGVRCVGSARCSGSGGALLSGTLTLTCTGTASSTTFPNDVNRASRPCNWPLLGSCSVDLSLTNRESVVFAPFRVCITYTEIARADAEARDLLGNSNSATHTHAESRTACNGL